MYRCKFYDKSDLVMVLEIEGDNRCQIINNIIKEEWTREGDFIIEEEELENVIYNMIFGGMPDKLGDDYYKEDIESEYIRNLTSRAELGLDITPFLSSRNKKIDSEGILKLFCKEIKDEWEYSNDYLNITYKIYKIQ